MTKKTKHKLVSLDDTCAPFEINSVNFVWQKICEKADIEARRDAAKRWHAKDSGRYQKEIEDLRDSLEWYRDALVQERFAAKVPRREVVWECLLYVLRTPSIIPYDGFRYPFFDIDHNEKGEITDDDEYWEEYSQTYGALMVPDYDFLVLKKLVDAEKLPRDLVSLMKKSDDLASRHYFRANIDAERNEVLMALREFFSMCASRSRALGDIRLAEDFVGACRAILRIRDNLLEPPKAEDVDVVVQTFTEALLRLKQLEDLQSVPEWSVFRKTVEDAAKKGAR